MKEARKCAKELRGVLYVNSIGNIAFNNSFELIVTKYMKAREMKITRTLRELLDAIEEQDKRDDGKDYQAIALRFIEAKQKGEFTLKEVKDD